MPLKIVKHWYSQCKKEYFERLVEIFKNVISFQINLQLKRTINEEKLVNRIFKYYIFKFSICLYFIF